MMSVLTVQVVEAKGLPKMDLGTTGTVDPYLMITCGESKRRTKVKKGSYSPVWDEEFVFKGATEDDLILFEVAMLLTRSNKCK